MQNSEWEAKEEGENEISFAISHFSKNLYPEVKETKHCCINAHFSASKGSKKFFPPWLERICLSECM